MSPNFTVTVVKIDNGYLVNSGGKVYYAKSLTGVGNAIGRIEKDLSKG